MSWGNQRGLTRMVTEEKQVKSFFFEKLSIFLNSLKKEK